METLWGQDKTCRGAEQTVESYSEATAVEPRTKVTLQN